MEKKLYKCFVTGFIMMFLIISCSKEFDEDSVLSFRLDFNETNIEALLDTQRTTEFSIAAGTDINAGDFQIQYTVAGGTGSYSINDIAIVENQFTDLPAGSDFIIEYLGTSVGTHDVSITIREVLSGRQEQVNLRYTISDTAFIFNVTPSPEETTYVGGVLDLNLSIEEISSADYVVSYTFGTTVDTADTGAVDILIDGISIDPNTDIQIQAGETIWLLEGVSQGIVELVFTVTSSLGVEVVETILVEVDDTPDFDFSADTTTIQTPIDTAVDVSFLIEETTGISTYMMSYTTTGEGSFILEGITYTAGDAIPVEAGDFIGQYIGSLGGEHTVVFTVVNANNVPISRMSQISVTYIEPDVEIPVIDLNGPEEITLTVFDLYAETATASDNIDGNITSDIVFGGDFLDTNTLGAFTRTYNVMDSSGNEAIEVSRIINVIDDVAPVIDLGSPPEVVLTVGDDFIDTVTASDNFDGDLTNAISFDGSTFTDTDTPGTFNRIYNVMDSSGNEAIEMIRTIIVEEEDEISFDRSTGILIAPAGTSVSVMMNSGGSGSGTAFIRAEDNNGLLLSIGITCYGLSGGAQCLDSDNDGVDEVSVFSFTMPSDGIAVFIGLHDSSDQNSGTSFSITVATEIFNGSMGLGNGIPN